jgi:hypothetical protein
MSSEYCPHCGAIRNMRETVSRREETTPEGETKEIETRTFHCETCNAFVRSDDTEVPRDEA